MSPLGELLGESASIAEVRERAVRLLKSTAGAGRRLPPVLILGETGTGKGLIASALHRASGRAAGPFIDVNCAAIPETLIEAELFGFERGAFTDARQAKPGLFQAANGGTIFLDEVGLLPLALQSKLLKVIEERSVRRLGGTRSEPLDVGVTAATSEDLAAAVQEGRFRADLYHRLAVVTLELPPLRSRGRDVLLLADHFLRRACEDYGLPARRLTEDARAALIAHDWPGNIRELANVLERAALLSDGPTLTAAHLGLRASPRRVAASAIASAGEPDAAAGERRLLLETLRATAWNLTRAAARLGLPRNTLRYRAERLGLTPEGPPERRRGGRPPAERRAAPVPAHEVAEAPRETRRVTLLLARLLPAGIASADWSSARALEVTAAKMRSFGGHIEELAPSGLLASFGLEPDEDAPRRAAHAAVAVQTLAARVRGDGESAPGMKIALHTAAVGVIHDGDALEADLGAAPDARRLLEALLDTAEPGSVVATAATGRFLARRFDLLPLPTVDAAIAGAFRIVRHSDLGRTRFVGRERELRLLGERFELAQAGQGQVVTIVGEAGIGKSRLLHEFRRRLGRRATWVVGHALSFGRAMPFHAVIDMLRRVFRVGDADAEATIVEKLERGVGRLGPEAVATLPFVRYLLSVDPGDPSVPAMDPKLRHAAILRATHLLLELGAELQPHVIVLEDVHWSDPATEDWITRLADGITTKRVLVVTTCRPGYRPPLGGRSFHTGLALATLSVEESAHVARGLLDVEELPPALQALVVDKAEGNPFFIEELVRSLEELGAVRRAAEGVLVSARLDQVAVPDTIEEVVLARLRRLDPPLQRLVEVAAVIGKNVPFPLLREVTGQSDESLGRALEHLRAAEFVYEARTFPEVEHTFKHALTHDVAYNSVTPAERRDLHARIVRAIERLYRDRLGEHVERLAYHAPRGGLWEEAVTYARRAGDKAFDRSANREAVASFEQALEALQHLPERRESLEAAVDVRLTLRSALLQLGEIRKIAEHLGQAEALAIALGDRRRLAWVWTYTTIAHLFAGEPARALPVGERALAVAEEVGDVGLRATARTPLAHACRELGDYRRAIALLAETIRALGGDLLRERFGQGMPPSLYARSMSAICLAEVGEFDQAVRLGSESAGLAETLDLPFGLVLARIALGYAALVEGRLEDAERSADRALEVIGVRGIPTWVPWAAAIRGYAMALSGRTAAGVEILEHARERAVALPFLFGHSQWLAWLAHAHLRDGRADAAATLAAEALELSCRRRERGYEAWALHILAEVEAARAHAATADTVRRRALALALDLGMRPLAARCGAPQP